MKKKYHLIILDRDGVINQDSPDFIKSPAEWHAIPGSLAAIAKLNQAGYRVVVCSNQSGVARGLFDLDILQAINEKMLKELANVGGHLDKIYCCPHGPDENCLCRKPKPGLYQQALQDFAIAANNTLVVGDALRDLQAAAAIDCDSILVLTGKGEKTQQQLANPVSQHIVQDLAHLVNELLA